MTLRIKYYSLAAGLVLAAACLPVAEGANGGRYDGLDACEFSGAGGRVTASARCGRFTVPEDAADESGRTIELAYAVVPARGGRAESDPVFFLAGGPGQSARDMLPFMRIALRDVNRTRDLIFLDQRGTGGSNRLDCRFDEPENVLDQDHAEMSRQLQACLAEWDADVRHYTTTDGARDIEALRQRYGFDQINLIGGSYGTRMAQVYLRHYPDRVRSIVLDGVVPTRLHLGSEHGLKLDQGLAAVFSACSTDSDCAEAYPDLSTAFSSLLDRYNESAPELIVTHPRTGQGVDLRFTRDVLASSLRLLAYAPETQMMIPYLVHEAATTGDPSRLASQALMTHEQLDEMIAIGLNFSVGCTEDWPGWPRIEQGHTLMGNSMTEVYEHICSWWPAGEVSDGFHVPFDSEVPVLILSGEFDPVTPPEYGEEAAHQYSNSRHLIGTGLGHIVSTHPCFGGIIAGFVAQAGVADLDTSCMESLGREPFFVNLLGPKP